MKHAALGAALAIAPDAALAVFGKHSRWLPESHPLVRLHRLLHSPVGLAAVCYGSHLVADRYTKHNARGE